MKLSNVIAMVAAIVALLAFAATAWQAYLSRQYNRLSVRPNLYIHEIRTTDRPFSLSIANNGLGPAIIESISITVNSRVHEKLDQDYRLAFRQAIQPHFAKFKLNIFDKGEVIAAGSSIELFSFRVDTHEVEELKIATAIMNDFKARIAYRSMYMEYFRLDHPKQEILSNCAKDNLGCEA